jgi:hypothetical protein
MRGQGRRHWVVTVDGNVATFSSLVHASHALRTIGIVASPSRLYSEVYDSECRAQGIATPRRIVELLPRVTISKGRVG